MSIVQFSVPDTRDDGDVGLGRIGLSIRAHSAFHLGKWPKTRFIRNFELRRIREASRALGQEYIIVLYLC